MQSSLIFYICLFIYFITEIETTYDRNEIQKQHPGFGTEWIALYNDKNEKVIGYFTTPSSTRSMVPVGKDSVFFKLFTRQDSGGVDVENLTSLECSSYDKSKPTKFVTHGWMSSGSADTCITIKDGFLKKYDANVFIMDWSKISDNIFYPIPMQATPEVAEYYSNFLNELINDGLEPENLHLVGHSLGAHISGFAARQIEKGKIARVTGLDPALPGFKIGLVEDGHLTQSDAEFVDVIHTCAGYLGMDQPIGHADFYPNSGIPPQPGCESISSMIEACSHGRSWKFFAESLTSSTPFMAYKCSSFDDFLGNCRDFSVEMGDPAPMSARGTFFLKTQSRAPFALKF